MVTPSGHLSCIDADMALDGSPGCLLGPLQMPCVFGAIDGFSTPCIFSRGGRTGQHDECPSFPQADAPFLPSTVRRVQEWDVGALKTAFFNNASVVEDACRILQIQPQWCPAVGDIFGTNVYAMFEMRLSVLQEIVDLTTSIREIYLKFLPLYLYRILGSNISSHFPLDDFKIRMP